MLCRSSQSELESKLVVVVKYKRIDRLQDKSWKFPQPCCRVGVCDTAVVTTVGGLTTGWWSVVLECFSSHPVVYNKNIGVRTGRIWGIASHPPVLL